MRQSINSKLKPPPKNVYIKLRTLWVRPCGLAWHQISEPPPNTSHGDAANVYTIYKRAGRKGLEHDNDDDIKLQDV